MIMKSATNILASNLNHESQIETNRKYTDAAFPEVKVTPSRFRNAIGKYRLRRDSSCIACGKCAEVCPYGVHIMRNKKMMKPADYLCIGFNCNKCVEACPQSAISLEFNPITGVIGDRRWTPDLLISNWYMAETGEIPPEDIEYKTGDSGGGFDRLGFRYSKERPEELNKTDFSTKIPLNRLNDGRTNIEIDIPIYGGGMSYGSISLHAMIARARAWRAWNSFTCTGEGGYPEELKPYDDNVITQVATGLFGVREETIQRVKIIEFKYAQGAKPGLGGHLLGDKVTVDVARMREAVPGSSLFSPFPFHSVYSVEDHKKHIDWIKEINPNALVSVKVSTPTDVDMVAVGSYYAGAHIIHLDGSYGGTGAAPDIAKKNIAMPIEYAIVKVHNFLRSEGIRDKITVIASGGIRTADDIAKAIALGADGAVVGTAEMVALECIRCKNCESGRGCARGIATTDPELTDLIDVNWATQRLINLFSAWRTRLIEILYRLEMRDIRELVGRTDCLRHLDYEEKGI
jgi:glutamate synthase domain-containing protein 2/NAD-dependent dihydropyrimidine dehydrogenase PreA subunit